MVVEYQADGRYVNLACFYQVSPERYTSMGTFFGKDRDEWSLTLTSGDDVTVTISGTIACDLSQQEACSYADLSAATAFTQSQTMTVEFVLNGVTVITDTSFRRSTSTSTGLVTGGETAFAMSVGGGVYCHEAAVSTGPDEGFNTLYLTVGYIGPQTWGSGITGAYQTDIRGYTGDGSVKWFYRHYQSYWLTSNEYYSRVTVLPPMAISPFNAERVIDYKFGTTAMLLRTAVGTYTTVVEPDWPIIP